ncbi:MAG: hypothetical protein U0359_35670 [Byssovorax sp.]
MTTVGVGDALFWTGAVMQGKAGAVLATAGVWTHLLSGSIVHLAHRQWAKAGASLGINVGAPLVLGVVGASFGYVAMLARGRSGDEGGLVLGEVVFGGAIGLVLGGMAATVLDSMALGYEPVVVRPPPKAEPTFSIAPMLGGGHKGLSLGGRF